MAVGNFGCAAFVIHEVLAARSAFHSRSKGGFHAGVASFHDGEAVLHGALAPTLLHESAA